MAPQRLLRRPIRPVSMLVVLPLALGLGIAAGPLARVIQRSAHASSAVAVTVSIHQIQGASQVSPLTGRSVADVHGVVTATDPTGFWMQDRHPDGRAATSEGIFVFTGSAPSVTVHNAVRVAGTVGEYRPGGAASANLSTTEIESPTVTVTAASMPLPKPVTVGAGVASADRTVPGRRVDGRDPSGDVETSGRFDPRHDGIDFWESLEGMRVEIDRAVVVGPTNSYGETAIAPPRSGLRTSRGGLELRPHDPNPERIIFDSSQTDVPSASVGDRYHRAVGVVDYSFGDFHLIATQRPAHHASGLRQQVAHRRGPHQMSVATFNVENLSPADGSTKFQALARQIVHNLRAPDLIALEEVQDDDGPTDDGVVDATSTLSMLTVSIRAAGGPSYHWRQISPVNDADGGEPGGNIRVVFLYRTDRGLHFVRRAPGGPRTATHVERVHGQVRLTHSPGRIAPRSNAWASSRKPLVGEFRFRGRAVFVVANHFDAKLGDTPIFGRQQPPLTPSTRQRHAQARLVRRFVHHLLDAAPHARVIVMGDLNDFDFSGTLSILRGAGPRRLLDLPATLPLRRRYTYDYEGNSEVLDHMLLSPSLVDAGYGYQVVHTNAEFAHQLSDHDPQEVRLDFRR